ncbi:flotillin-2 [Nilaparvata lugens]|uniref:flotillin-2 n=1 Tax=Nilaparvata lugens TaxID=108931 RepID=UPI00193E6862|nr:flotillin-2 [Nilaparvata lugens]
MGNFYTTGPNRVMVLYGGCCGKKTKVKYIIGGWTWKWAAAEKINYIPLEIISARLICKNVMTAMGVPITATGLAHFKVMSAREMLPIAAESFLGKSKEQIRHTIKLTLEGHLRAILATLTVEEIFKERYRFVDLVLEIAKPDVAKMGIEIVSFTINELRDENMYMQSLGRKHVAVVKSAAAIRAAECERDACKAEAECHRETVEACMLARLISRRERKRCMLEKMVYEQQINRAKADVDLAYELQVIRVKQEIEKETKKIDVIERQKMVEIENKEVVKTEKILLSEVQLLAAAESYKIQTIAEGKRIESIKLAEAESERIRRIGLSMAEASEKLGKATALNMKLKAEAYKKFGRAALQNIALNAIPKIAAEACYPLSNVANIVMLDSGEVA